MKQKGRTDPQCIANMQPGAANHVYPKAYRFFEQKRYNTDQLVPLVALPTTLCSKTRAMGSFSSTFFFRFSHFPPCFPLLFDAHLTFAPDQAA
jgi:hypothetical protein